MSNGSRLHFFTFTASLLASCFQIFQPSPFNWVIEKRAGNLTVLAMNVVMSEYSICVLRGREKKKRQFFSGLLERDFFSLFILSVSEDSCSFGACIMYD